MSVLMSDVISDSVDALWCGTAGGRGTNTTFFAKLLRLTGAG